MKYMNILQAYKLFDISMTLSNDRVKITGKGRKKRLEVLRDISVPSRKNRFDFGDIFVNFSV